MIKRNARKFSVVLNASLLSLALIAAASPLTASAQSNLGFLANTPLTSLNKTQIKSLTDAIKSALEAGANAQTSEWSSGKAQGPAAKITPHFTDNKPPCAIVILELTAKGVTQNSKVPYCQNEKGVWTLVKR